MNLIVLIMILCAAATQTYLSGPAAISSSSTLAVLSIPFLLAVISVKTAPDKKASGVSGIFLGLGLLWLVTVAVRPEPSFETLLFALAPAVLAFIVFRVGKMLESRHATDGNYLFYFSAITGLCAVIMSDTASVSYGLIYATLVLSALLGWAFKQHLGTDSRALCNLLKMLFLLVTTAAVIFGALPQSIGGIFFMLFIGTEILQSVRSVRVATMMFLPLLLLACTPMKPSGGRYQHNPEQGTVMFQLSPEGMNLLLSEQWRVRVRVHKVEQGVRGDQEGNDAIFEAADANPTFRIDGVKLGLKDFILDIINASNESIGHGEARHLVRPGEQALQEIRIKIVPPDLRRRELAMNWVVRVKTEGEQPKVTYQNVKQTFVNYCVSCHGADSRPQPAGKLVLSDYPFYYTNGAADPAAIVEDSLFWMKAADYPMPPSPAERVPADQIAAIQQWVTDGLLKFPRSDNTSDLAHKIIVHWELPGTTESGTWEVERPDQPDEPFRCKLENAVVGAKYKFRSEIFGVDGTKVYEKTMEHTVEPAGEAMIEVEIEGGNPTVSIPVVIEQ